LKKRRGKENSIRASAEKGNEFLAKRISGPKGVELCPTAYFTGEKKKLR